MTKLNREKEETVKKKRGRKSAVFDYKEIEKYASLGLTQIEIALAMGWGQACFFNHKREDEKIEEAIRRGRAKFKVIVSQNLVRQMQSGNVTAAIWLDKTRCGTIQPLAQNVNVGEIVKQIKEFLNEAETSFGDEQES